MDAHTHIHTLRRQVGGSYNGLINFFDLRKPGGLAGTCVPLESSVIEKSHHDPGTIPQTQYYVL
jgi:hypothetical protein